MKKLLTALILVFPVACNGQSIPQMDRHVTLQGPQGLNWALSTKLDTSNGVASNLTRTNGSDTNTDVSAAIVTAANSFAAGTKARTPAERALSVAQPQDFLAPVQAVADVITAKIDIAPIINLMISLGINTINVPCGTYMVASQINLASNVSISGSGGCTILSVRMKSGDVISGIGVQYTSVHDLIIQADATRTKGSSIYFNNSFENRIYNIIFTNGIGKHWSDIYLDGANGTHIDRVAGRGGAWNGITLTGTTKRTEDTYIANSGFDGYGNAPLELIWASGAYLSDLDFLGGVSAGVMIDPQGQQEVDGLRGTAVLADSNYGPGWSFAGSGAITEINLTNCWAATNGIGGGNASGLEVINKAVNNLTVSNSEFHANTAAGINIDQGNRITLIGNMSFMNSTSGKGAFPGIKIGASPNFVIASYNQSGAGGEAQGSASQSQQSYGLQSDMPGDDLGHYGVITGNIGTGNQMGGFRISTGTNITQSNNVGY